VSLGQVDSMMSVCFTLAFRLAHTALAMEELYFGRKYAERVVPASPL
jgi:hypothetical protein